MQNQTVKKRKIHLLLNRESRKNLTCSRDINATINIEYIAERIWETGARSTIFARPQPAEPMNIFCHDWMLNYSKTAISIL